MTEFEAATTAYLLRSWTRGGSAPGRNSWITHDRYPQMSASLAAVLLAVLLPGLSGCTAQEWERTLAGPPPVTVALPTDQELSCDEIEETRNQVVIAGLNEWSDFDNADLNRVRALTLRSKYLRSLYKAKGCAELVELQAMQYCLDIDRASRAGSGYSLKEYIRQYGITPKLVAKGDQTVAAIAACLDILP